MRATSDSLRRELRPILPSFVRVPGGPRTAGLLMQAIEEMAHAPDPVRCAVYASHLAHQLEGHVRSDLERARLAHVCAVLDRLAVSQRPVSAPAAAAALG